MSFKSWSKAIQRSLWNRIFAKPDKRVQRCGLPRLGLETLEDRVVPSGTPTLNFNAVIGGTLNLDPISSIFPASPKGDEAYTRMDVLATNVPGLNYGTMALDTGTNVYDWGTGSPNPFEPANSSDDDQNRIYAGEGFQYINNSQGLGQTETIPVDFSNGFQTTDYNLIIHINSPVGEPKITAQPAGLTSILLNHSATLSVQAAGNGTLTYQWYSGLSPDAADPIAGATSSTYTTPLLDQVNQQNYYWVRVSNDIGVADSLDATVYADYATSTTVSRLNVIFSTASRTVSLSADVTSNVGFPSGSITYVIPGIGTLDSQFNNGLDNAIFTIPAGTPAGAYPIEATYSGSGSYAVSSNISGILTVDKAAPQMTWPSPSPIVDGTLLSDTQLDATSNTPGTFTYSPAAGTLLAPGAENLLAVSFTPTDTADYTTAFASTTIDVQPGSGGSSAQTPTISWKTPSVIAFGTRLGVTQLDATASVPGTFTYAPAEGTTLDPGNNEELVVSFVPNDTADYAPVTVRSAITVTKAIPEIVWPAPANLTYGQELSDTQLDAMADVPGIFTYSMASGTVPAAGEYSLSVKFTPGDTTDYFSTSTTVPLTVEKATPQITWANPLDITYGTALSGQQLDAGANVPGTFNYTPGLHAVLHAGIQTLSATFTPTDSTDYNSTSATVSIDVAKATPVLDWTDPAAIDYGTPLGKTQLDARTRIAGSFSYTPSAGTLLHVGNGQTLSTTFTPTDTTDYNSVTATVSIDVDKAKPVIQWTTPATISYGTALSGAQLDAAANVPGAFLYSLDTGSVLPPGTYSVTGYFTPTDETDYTTAQATTKITIIKAIPVVTWTNPAPVPPETALSSTQLDATANVPGIFNYSPTLGMLLKPGVHNLTVTFVPTVAADYAIVKKTVTIQVDKITPTITWANPEDITYGIPLSKTQLDATANIPGIFSYSRPAGTILHAGDDQTLTAIFTPTDSTDYRSVTKTVSIDIQIATPRIVWADPAYITYGTPLSSAQLDATANAAGTFTYSPAAGTRLDAGNDQTLSVVFTPKDAADYTSASMSVVINVHKAQPAIEWANPKAITYGTPLGVAQFDATANAIGTFTYSPAVGQVLSASSGQRLFVLFTPADPANYDSASKTVLINVNKAPLEVTAAGTATYGNEPTVSFSYSGFVDGQTLATSGVSGLPGSNTKATLNSAPGTYNLNVTAGSLNSANYQIRPVPGKLIIQTDQLMATATDFSVTAGAPFRTALATFPNADPYGTAASYTASVDWGDGSDTSAIISGSGATLTVSGAHTYSASGTYTVQLVVTNTQGYTTTARASSTATVTSLGLDVESGQTLTTSFWKSNQGLALIKSFNGGSSQTALSTWLASSFPNIYGGGDGGVNLSGKNNAQIASYFDKQDSNLNLQVLTAALNIYATTTSLGGDLGIDDGFLVTDAGLGASEFNVGSFGQAFGVTNDTQMTVFALLCAINDQAAGGVLYKGQEALKTQAVSLLNQLN